MAFLLPPATVVSVQAVCLLTRQAGRWAHLVLNPGPGPAESNLIPQAHKPWAGQLPIPHSPHAWQSPGTSFLQDRRERTTKRKKGEGISRGRTEAPRRAVLFPDAQMFPSISAHPLLCGGSGAGPRLPCGGRNLVFTPNALGHPGQPCQVGSGGSFPSCEKAGLDHTQGGAVSPSSRRGEPGQRAWAHTNMLTHDHIHTNTHLFTHIT